MDLSGFPLKTDIFEGMHMLPAEVEKVEGAPNFRQVSSLSSPHGELA